MLLKEYLQISQIIHVCVIVYVILGIQKRNGEELLDKCEIIEIFISSNFSKTVRCKNYIARSFDFLVIECDKCKRKYKEGVRSFKAKNFQCFCRRCSIEKTSLSLYGVISPNQDGNIKAKQHKTGKTYESGPASPIIPQTNTPEELALLRSDITSRRWRLGFYNFSIPRFSEAAKRRWLDPNFREKILVSLRSEAHRKRSSELCKKRWKENPLQTLASLKRGLSSRISKVHRRWRDLLKLEDLGFKSEQIIGKFIVDELNNEKKIVIEIYGDYVHANPKYYKSDDIIKLANSRYTSQEKWDYDKVRLENLRSLGFKVIVIWESDKIEDIQLQLNSVIDKAGQNP